MYYVAKLYRSLDPVIIEKFEDKQLAFDYINIMSKANKGQYIVLEQSTTRKESAD